MAKFLKLKISKAMSRSFHSCRSKDPSTLPQHPVPSLSPNTQLIKVDNFLFEEIIHQNNESLLISTDDEHLSGTLVTAGGRCSSRNVEAPSDDSHTRSHSHEFKWHHVVETTYDDDTIDQQHCTKLSYSSVSDDSDNNELVLAKKNKRWSSRKKKISRNSKIKLFMMMRTTSSSSSADESGINFTNEKANWDYHDEVDSNNEDEEEKEDDTQTIVSSSSKTCVDFSDDFTQELEPIYENAMTRSPKKIATKKRRVKNTRGMIMSKNGRRSSISTSSDGELPPRLSELIPCSVEGKVRESFAILKKSEDPFEDFKSSMMEMILEKKMFEKNDLEQLLQCFLSINAKNYHGVIVEAFSEIWNTLFSPKS